MDYQEINKLGQHMSDEQNEIVEDSINKTFLLVITGKVTDPSNIFNMFWAFENELSKLGQIFAYPFITGTPINLKLSKNQTHMVRHFDKIFHAIELDNCTLVPPME